MSDTKKSKFKHGGKASPKGQPPVGGGGGSNKQTRLKIDETYILYAMSENVRNAASFDQFKDSILTLLMKEVPEVANELFTEESCEPVKPIRPVLVPLKGKAADEDASDFERRLEEYELAKLNYPSELMVANQLEMEYRKELTSYRKAAQRGCAIYWEHLSKIMQERILHENPDMRVCRSNTTEQCGS